MKTAPHAASAAKFEKALARIGMNQSQFARAVGMGDRHIRKLVKGEVAVQPIVWLAVEHFELLAKLSPATLKKHGVAPVPRGTTGE